MKDENIEERRSPRAAPRGEPGGRHARARAHTHTGIYIHKQHSAMAIASTRRMLTYVVSLNCWYPGAYLILLYRSHVAGDRVQGLDIAGEPCSSSDASIAAQRAIAPLSVASRAATAGGGSRNGSCSVASTGRCVLALLVQL